MNNYIYIAEGQEHQLEFIKTPFDLIKNLSPEQLEKTIKLEKEENG